MKKNINPYSKVNGIIFDENKPYKLFSKVVLIV